ncbi:hypothetical protein [Paracoccus hibiscisoli]|uniref:hypothetical protein n=1 Tax=Paracoccus hibiscisoli TaxID=2023261 RepID=UPI0023F5892A|nr:hypothetical protein [Paracoccus hibiscisoli]
MTALERHITERLTGTAWCRIQAYGEAIAANAAVGYYLEASGAGPEWTKQRRESMARDLQAIADHLGLSLVVPSDAAAVSAIGNLSHAMQIADARHAARREAGE